MFLDWREHYWHIRKWQWRPCTWYNGVARSSNIRLYVYSPSFLFLLSRTNSLLEGLDYPYLTTLLPNSTVEIHLLEDQSIKQVVAAPPTSRPTSPLIAGQPRPISGGRIALANSVNGYMVPSSERSDKMRKTSVPLRRGALGAIAA